MHSQLLGTEHRPQHHWTWHSIMVAAPPCQSSFAPAAYSTSTNGALVQTREDRFLFRRVQEGKVLLNIILPK